MLHYANHLASAHDVTAVFVPFKPPQASLLGRIKAMLQFVLGKLSLLKWKPTWFELDQRVTPIWCVDVRQIDLKQYDHIVVSFWHTASYLRHQTALLNRCSYLVQEYEYYRSADAQVRSEMDKNFAAGFGLMAISPAVDHILKPFQKPIKKMPNGIEFDDFYLSQAIDSPSRNLVMFPARLEPFKRTLDAVEAIERLPKALKQKFEFVCYGLKQPSFSERLQKAGIMFYQSPTNHQLHELLNRCAVFVTPSEYEGWGLPGAEAMACGAALVSTDNGGVSAYACHNETALIVGVGDVANLSQSIEHLLLNFELRQRLARKGQEAINAFTWQAAGQRMLNYIEAAA